MRVRLEAVLVGLLMMCAAASGRAQTPQTAIVPETVSVGDVFHVVVRVEVPAGGRVVLPDSLPVSNSIENAGRMQRREETVEGGDHRVTALYPLTAWRPGELPLPDIPAMVVGSDRSERSLRASLPTLRVRTVLPADTSGIEPRQAKGVLGPDWALWPFVALAAGLLGGGGIAWWLRRNGAAAPVPAEAAPPHERALALLDGARSRGLVESGQVKLFYSLIGGALRGYLAAVEPDWGTDRTTTELLVRLDDAMDDEPARELARLLERIDRVKFAGLRPPSSDAIRDWRAARAWVEAVAPSGDAEEADASASTDRMAAEGRGEVA